jgi:hypothetical protein
MHDLAKIAEVLDRSEALSLKDDFAFEIMNVVQRMPVAIRPRLEIGNGFSELVPPSFGVFPLS